MTPNLTQWDGIYYMITSENKGLQIHRGFPEVEGSYGQEERQKSRMESYVIRT